MGTLGQFIFWTIFGIGYSAFAQDHAPEVGVVTLLVGDVEYTPLNNQIRKAKNWAPVSLGDRFLIPANSQIRILIDPQSTK